SGPPAFLREQKTGAFVATGGKHDGGDRYLLPAPALEMDLEPPDPALRPVAEAEYRHAEGNEEAFPLRERPAVKGMDARHVAPAFKRVIAEGVICLHSGQRCTKHRLPCPECRAGRFQERCKIALAQRPLRNIEPRPVAEIDRVVGETATTPEIGCATKLARHGDVGAIVVVGAEVLPLRQGLCLRRRPETARFEQKDTQALLVERQRRHDSDRTTADDADVSSETTDGLGGWRLVNHRTCRLSSCRA